MEDPDLMPMSPIKDIKLRNYLDDIRSLYYKDVRNVVLFYSTQITTAFGV